MIVFDVAADGTTSNCKVVAKHGQVGRTDACERLAGRGKYQPAISLTGQPVATRKAEIDEWAMVEFTTVDN